MAGRPLAEQRRIEEADADALTLAWLQANVRVLLREAEATANEPRYRRLIEMHAALDALRLRAVARKQ